MRTIRSLGLLLLLLSLTGAGNSAGRQSDDDAAGDDWHYYHGNPGGTHYSRLKDINTANVSKLKIAWVYDTGEDVEGIPTADMQSNPLIIRGQLFFVSSKGRLISVDAANGKPLWTFDPAAGQAVYTRQRLRGVSYWSDRKARRILFTFRGYLYSVDADTGHPVRDFGKDGRVDLREGLGRDPATVSVSNSSPGVVFKELIIMGSGGHASPGHIRAFDVRTGKLRWAFHTIPHPGEYGYETWPKDAWKTAIKAYNWAGMTLDRARALIFVPLATGDGRRGE